MTNRERIENYCSHFDTQILQLKKLESRLHKKVLLMVILDTLSRARYSEVQKNNERFMLMIDNCAGWQEGSRISLNNLALSLTNSTPSKLREHAVASISRWNEGEMPGLEVDPFKSELECLAATDQEKQSLKESRHSSLLYIYRNHLIHEFREPGAGMETDQRDTSPYYHRMTHLHADGHNERESWELVYPLGFFVTLVTSCLKNLKHHLMQNDLDPYSFYKFGTLWSRRI